MATWTNSTLHTATYTNANKTGLNSTAAAGQYYGFGAFTYSGGQTLVYTPIVWTNVTKD